MKKCTHCVTLLQWENMLKVFSLRMFLTCVILIILPVIILFILAAHPQILGLGDLESVHVWKVIKS